MKTKLTSLFHSKQSCALGQVTLAGILMQSPGMPRDRLRLYGTYAMTLILNGTGCYRDANGIESHLTSGNVVLVFPDIAHNYAPYPGGVWDESYFVFRGPSIDLLRGAGLMCHEQPVIRVQQLWNWHSSFTKVLTDNYGDDPRSVQLRVSRFSALLAEMLIEASVDGRCETTQTSIERSRGLLSANLSEPARYLDIAQRVGLQYETFRKMFTRQCGMSPNRFRLRKRIAVAADLLIYTEMSNREIADNVGFSDEFAFSKRFRHETGESPKQYRMRKHLDLLNSDQKNSIE